HDAPPSVRPPRRATRPDRPALLELVLQRLAGLELGRLRRRDIDALTRLRIAAGARLALRDRKGSKGGYVDLVAVSQRLHDVLEDEVHGTFRLSLRQIKPGGDGVDQLGLRHR